MGDLKVTGLTEKKQKNIYIHQLVQDLKALDYMLQKGMIEKSPLRIGAEQEFCLTDSAFLPKSNSLDILDLMEDSHFTTEIGKYNLELNLDPLVLGTDCLSSLKLDLDSQLDKLKKIARKQETLILLTGILPTLRVAHLSEFYMTPIPRYNELNKAMKRSRSQDFYIHIKGVDEVNLLHDSVMLEACNTSFQTHLQIDPSEGTTKYNWSQAISGPVLSVCANSPLLFGRELWAETRIALFSQSTDTRENSFVLNESQARVSFGNHWETKGLTHIFRDNISRHRSLLNSVGGEDSLQLLKEGIIPKLKALNLHNGTVYRWNRLCYGVGNGVPHLRIECRYIPSGPSTLDEVANMAFWIGVMLGQPDELKDIEKNEDFRNVRNNFYRAARTGLDSVLIWMGKRYPARDLIREIFLPMAVNGLKKLSIPDMEIGKYLGIISKRLDSGNGSEWILKNYRQLQKSQKPYEALQVLTSVIYENQQKDLAVCDWEPIKDSKPFPLNRIVKHHMNTQILSVDPEDSLELVINMMEWNSIHHLPVIDDKKKLVGLLSWNDVKDFKERSEIQELLVKDVMKRNLITTTQDAPLQSARDLMELNGIGCLPVINQQRLIGIITRNDLPDGK